MGSLHLAILFLLSTVPLQGKGYYHTYPQLVQEFINIADSFPAIALLDTLGYSVSGNPIVGLKISNSPTIVKPEPSIRFNGCHHGDEQVAAENVLYLAHYLTSNYTNPEIKNLVDTHQIWIIAAVNPDGMINDTRYNANGIDLNRDYGYMWEYGWSGASIPFSQPETRASRENALENNFMLGFDYHSDANVINCLWDYTDIRTQSDSIMINIAKEYSDSTGQSFIHGYDWYEVHGSCQDAMYGCNGSLDYTIETPQPTDPTPVCQLTLKGMLGMIKRAGDRGIEGIVTDSLTGDPVDARVNIHQINWPIYTNAVTGFYHYILLPGTYNVIVSANGYFTKTISGIVVGDSVTHLNISLNPSSDGLTYAHRIVWASVADPNDVRTNHTLTPSILGAPDGVFLSIGVGGKVVVDMQNTISESITVYAGNDGETAEGYKVFASNDWQGSFQSVGTGTGTKTFSITGQARYIEIADDSVGNPDDQYAGFDLDAIKAYKTVGTEEKSNTKYQISKIEISPNPFGGKTRINYTLSSKQKVNIKIYNIAGREVKTLLNEEQQAGIYSINLDAKGLSVGVYFIKLNLNNVNKEVKKVVLVR